MHNITLLACPYSDPRTGVRDERYMQAVVASAHLASLGKIVLCPVIMNHPVERHLNKIDEKLPAAFWRNFESAMADVCTEIVVFMPDGWRQSRGIQREIDLFQAAGKPVWTLSPDFALKALIDSPNQKS